MDDSPQSHSKRDPMEGLRALSPPGPGAPCPGGPGWLCRAGEHPDGGCPRGCETPDQKLTSQETSLPGMGERGGGRGAHVRARVSV